MRHFRHLALAAVAAALCVPSAANAQRGQLLTPHVRIDGLTGGEAMGQAWLRVYTLPTAENPAVGDGAPCLRVGRTASILIGLEYQPGRAPSRAAPRCMAGASDARAAHPCERSRVHRWPTRDLFVINVIA
jgi:hypothetical protein